MTEENLLERLGEEIEKYGFTSKATGEKLLGEVRRLKEEHRIMSWEWSNEQRENATLRSLLGEARPQLSATCQCWPTDTCFCSDKTDLCVRIDAALSATHSINVSQKVENGDLGEK